MSIVVRVSVHDDKGVFSPMQDKVRPILRLPLVEAKDAALSFIPSQDIIHSPRSPEMFHGFPILDEAKSSYPFFSKKRKWRVMGWSRDSGFIKF
jgi:hypothetical protein